MDTRHYVRRIAGLPRPPRSAVPGGSAELEKIELAYRALIEETGAGVAAVDAGGSLLFVNRGLGRMLGYGREEMMGRPFADFLHPEDVDRIARLLSDARKNPRQKLRLDFRALHKDGRTLYCDARPTVLPGRGREGAFYAIINDITAYHEAEERRRTAHERLQALLSSTSAVFFTCEPSGGFGAIYVSDNVAEMTGYEPESFLKNPRFRESRIHPQDREKVLAEWRGILTRKSLAVEFRFRRRDGGVLWVREDMRLIEDERGRPREIAGFWADITDRRAAEDSLRRSEMIHRHLFEQSNDPVLLIGLNGRLIGANQKAADMLGYRKDELAGVHFRDTIAPPEHPDAEDKFKALIEGRTVPHYFRTARRKDGKEFPVEINVSLVRDPGGRPLFIQSIVRDITERVKAEEAIRSALKEKDILLREIHHRVKNNMQIIVSLLRLQSRQIKEEALKEMFRISQARIQSMALIHEKLYQSRDLAGIDFGAYVEVLTAYLRSSSGTDASRIGMEVRIDDVRLDINRAIPCGLIINELVTNALKYAFPRPGGAARIRIAMSQGKNKRFSLTVSDNGVGLPESVSLERPETLGLQIVTDLVRQLDGRLAVNRAGGTTFRIDF
ncbi:MAG: PAS domain S-box protein [Candidatus Aminicenantes bacterium]|nr:PAS domain S-box protein [Candidatus Aminicenantes bacterium]